MLYLISLNLIKYLFCSHHFWTFVQCRQFQLSPNPTPGQGWWWSTGAADSARYWSNGTIDESWECLSLTTDMSLSFEKLNVFSLVLEKDRMSEVLCCWFTFLLFGDMSLNDLYEMFMKKTCRTFILNVFFQMTSITMLDRFQGCLLGGLVSQKNKTILVVLLSRPKNAKNSLLGWRLPGCRVWVSPR